MKVLKFGGTSVGNPERISGVLKILANRIRTEKRLSVVFSAYAGITDQLIRLGTLAAQSNAAYIQIFKDLEQRHLETVKALISVKNQSGVLAAVKISLNELEEILQGVYLVKELTAKTLDYIMSFGERLSTFTISEALKDQGVTNTYIDSRQIIKTDNNFGRARVHFKETVACINKYIPDRRAAAGAADLFLITGFIGSTSNNETTTLGRGGSDYSASIIGAALNAEEIEIWTDVDGVLTADPGKVKNAFPIDYLTYEEAMEMSHFGARVIYPPTMQPALNKNIPLRVKNTLNPGFSGSVISKRKKTCSYLIKGISSIDEIALVQIQGSGLIGIAGIAERVFSALAREKINVILISQASSEHSICLAIRPEHQQSARKALEEEFRYEIRANEVSEISIENDLTILAVVGENMRHTRGIAGKVFKSLGNNNINISAIAQGSSELNISMVIARKDEVKALNVLHDAFFSSGRRVLNLFLVGTGLIGKTLLSQLNRQQKILDREYRLAVNLIGLADIEQMVFDKQGISPGNWEEILRRRQSGRKTDLNKFVAEMKSYNLLNSVFIDCTMADAVVDKYPEILESSISIVTPNKKANARRYPYYLKLREYCAKYNTHFFYETNVGAALPIIGTMKDLLASGDRVVKIEGILSGTLSYIFNTFSGRQPFSTVIQQAREKGYTEPDPREDLSGQDVGRKLLILAREAGYALELSDIKIENLIPKQLRQARTVNEFFRLLPEYDASFEAKRIAAARQEKVLRYVARFENNRAEIGLTAVNSNHPFYNLSGSDNIIAFYTNYYAASPLIIRGPGAGAEVTAAGVLADILKIANFVS
jgi:aspartokinase/homoserine dehydrogenase 1